MRTAGPKKTTADGVAVVTDDHEIGTLYFANLEGGSSSYHEKIFGRRKVCGDWYLVTTLKALQDCSSMVRMTAMNMNTMLMERQTTDESMLDEIEKTWRKIPLPCCRRRR